MGGRHLPRTPGRLSEGRGRRSTSGSKQWDDPVPLLPFAPHPTLRISVMTCTKRRDFACLMSRARAGLETPDDLSADDR